MSKKSKGLLKFIAGVGIGVGAGMLLAPKTGKELRKDLQKKINELVDKAKEVDLREVGDDFMKKINELKEEIEDLDKEKVIEIAKKKGKELKEKANELYEMAKAKGTPVLEKAADEVRQRAILVTKDVLKKLEKEEAK